MGEREEFVWRNMASLLPKANYSLARMLSEFVAQSLGAPFRGCVVLIFNTISGKVYVETLI